MGRQKEGSRMPPVVIPDDMAETLRDISEHTGIPRAELVRRALRFMIQRAWVPETKTWRAEQIAGGKSDATS